jgi:hypothetical protein
VRGKEKDAEENKETKEQSETKTNKKEDTVREKVEKNKGGTVIKFICSHCTALVNYIY